MHSNDAVARAITLRYAILFWGKLSKTKNISTIFLG